MVFMIHNHSHVLKCSKRLFKSHLRYFEKNYGIKLYTSTSFHVNSSYQHTSVMQINWSFKLLLRLMVVNSGS